MVSVGFRWMRPAGALALAGAISGLLVVVVLDASAGSGARSRTVVSAAPAGFVQCGTWQDETGSGPTLCPVSAPVCPADPAVPVDPASFTALANPNSCHQAAVTATTVPAAMPVQQAQVVLAAPETAQEPVETTVPPVSPETVPQAPLVTAIYVTDVPPTDVQVDAGDSDTGYRVDAADDSGQTQVVTGSDGYTGRADPNWPTLQTRPGADTRMLLCGGSFAGPGEAPNLMPASSFDQTPGQVDRLLASGECTVATGPFAP